MRLDGKGKYVIGLVAIALILVGVKAMFSSGDKSDPLQTAAKDTMYASINKGCLRVDEALTINSEKAKETLVVNYEKIVGESDAPLSINIEEIQGTTPVLLASSSFKKDGLLPKLTNVLSRDSNNHSENVAFIFEANSSEKPKTAEFKGFTSEGDAVEDFQCHTN